MKHILASVIVLTGGLSFSSLGHTKETTQVIRHDRLTVQTATAQVKPKTVTNIQRTDRIRVVKFDAAEAQQIREKVARNDRVVFRKAI